MIARRAIPFASLVVLATVSFAPMPQSSLASPLRQLAPSVISFSSDGTRYAAWQVREDASIVVFDTLTGHRGTLPLPAGCELERQGDGDPVPVAGAGRFLLNCSLQHHGEQKAVLNARTGEVDMVPEGPSGFSWDRAGARYLEGWAADQTCQRTKRRKGPGEICVGLYDLVTGAIIDRAAWQVPDLDRVGAPPMCRALRHEVLAETERDAGLPRLWSYANGVFVHAEVLSTTVHVERCRGPAMVLRGRGEVKNFDVRGGLLTWDTGSDNAANEPEGGPSYGTLTSYRLASGKRRRWVLPSLSLGGSVLGRPSGVFGYSTHTANTVFWIASRTIGAEEKSTFVVTSSVYASRVR